VRTKLKAVFDSLVSWQDNPPSHSKEMKAYFEDFKLEKYTKFKVK
jgi:hypothetical protein